MIEFNEKEEKEVRLVLISGGEHKKAHKQEKRRKRKYYSLSGQSDIRFGHGEDRSGIARGKYHLPIDVGNLNDVARGVGFLAVDVANPEGLLFVHMVISGDIGEPECSCATVNHEEFVHDAVIHNFDRRGHLVSSAGGWVFLVNNSHVMGAGGPGGPVCLGMNFTAIFGPPEHDSTGRNLYSPDRERMTSIKGGRG